MVFTQSTMTPVVVNNVQGLPHPRAIVAMLRHLGVLQKNVRCPLSLLNLMHPDEASSTIPPVIINVEGLPYSRAIIAMRHLEVLLGDVHRQLSVQMKLHSPVGTRY